MSMILAALMALPLASAADPPAIRSEMALAVGPGLTFPVNGRLEADVAYDRFRVNGNLNPGPPGYWPFWGAWGSVGLVGSLRVIGGAVMSAETLSCPAAAGSMCPIGPVPYGVVPFAGLAMRTDIGGCWLEFRPWVALAGTGAAYPVFSLVNAFMAGPPTLELGWRVAPHLGVSLQSSVVPLKLTYQF
jgi:hypothetical protein